MIIRNTPPIRFYPAIVDTASEEVPNRVNTIDVTVIDNQTIPYKGDFESLDLTTGLTQRVSDCYDQLTHGLAKKHRWKMLKVLHEFSDDKLPTISQIISPILKDIKEVTQRTKILQAISKIAESDQLPFLLDIRPFLDQLKNFQDKYSLICGVKNLAPEKRKVYLGLALPFITNQDSSFLQMELINKLQELESGTNEDVLKLAIGLMHSETCLKDRITLIEGVRLMPQEVRGPLNVKAIELLSGLGVSEHSQLLQAILSDSPSSSLKKVEIVGYISRNLPKIPERGKFFLLLMKSTAELLELTVEIATPFFSIKEILDPIFLIKMLLQLEAEDLLNFSKWLRLHNQKEKLLEIASYLQNVRIRFSEGLRHMIQSENFSILKRQHLVFFMDYLLSHEQNLDEVIDVAHFLLDQYQTLGIDEESPLFTKAFQISELNQIVDTSPLNPYAVFKEHIRLHQASPLISPLKVYFEGKELYFDPTQGIKRSFRKVLTSDQLPQNISHSYFIDQICGMEWRITHLPVNVKQTVFQNIQTRIGLSFYQLKSNLTDVFFETSLSFASKKINDIPSYVVKLFQIILWLETLDKQPKEEGELSFFEQALIETSACICNCPEGKRFGISRVYRLLPSEFIKDHQSEILEDPLENFLYKFLFPFFEEKLENHDWIRGLLRTNKIQKVHELPHHVLFVRNRIGKYLGLSQPVQFDPFSGVLIKKILRLTPLEMIEDFFKELDFLKLLETLQKGYTQLDAKEKNSLFNFFNENCPKNLSEVWDEENDYTLTAKGALQMLYLSKLFLELPPTSSP
jgi:hypothetical protein